VGVGTRWWRRDDAEPDTDVWGGPGEVTLAPAPRNAPEDAEREEREQRERADREERERAEHEQRERAEREARERAERERVESEERDRAEQEQRAARERAEQERVEQARREREERQRADRERRERQRTEQERRVAARQEQVRREREEQRAAQERREQEQREQERREREQRDRERREQEQREQERRDQERREQEQPERAEQQQAAEAGSDDTELIPLAGVPVDPVQDRVTTVPGAEAVSPAAARDAEAREAAARAAAAAERRRRRHRVLQVFLVAVLAVAAVWILPWLVALVVALVSALGGTTAGGAAPSATETPVVAAAAPAAPAAEPRPALPRGGSAVGPEQRVVGLRADPATPPEETADRLDAAATPFATRGRPVLPALELPVRDDADASAAWRRLAVTRAHRQVLLLAVPVGPGDVDATVERWERLLREPDVGLVLDPPGPLPGPEVEATADRLAAIVRDAGLPQKLLVVPGTRATSPAPAEVAVVAVADGPDGAATPPVLRGVAVPPGDAAPRDVLATDPSPDVVLLR